MNARRLLIAVLTFAFPVALFRFTDPSQRTAAQPAPGPVAVKSDLKKDLQPFLAKYCFECHGNGKKRGGVSLEKFQTEELLHKHRKQWEAVVEMLRSREMPPKGKLTPPPAEAEAAIKRIESVLANVDCTGPRNVGRVTIRRLNRAEYNNTIRDLVGIDFKPAADFPPDDTGYGFDNIGDVLSLSPLLLEKYLNAAEAIVERAIIVADPVKPTKNKLGGLRASFGAGEQRKGVGIAVYKKGEAVGTTTIEAGDYTVRVEAYGIQVGADPVKVNLRVAENSLGEFVVKGNKAFGIKPIEAKVRLNAGQSRVAVAFLNPFTDANKTRRELIVKSIELDGPYNAPPPKRPMTHERLMAHKPGLKPREAAREILERFATRAFRRPVKTEEVERFVKLYDRAEKAGERFESAMRLALSGVLVSPHFLFRIELDPEGTKPGTTYAINDFELASRLSYFLWSSMPDDELFNLAAKGQLRENLDTQTRRMLKDPKSSAFVQNFAGQWLTIRGLAGATPDPKQFPQFDVALRSAMYRETEMFFEAILREERSILDFIEADFSFLNERLAKHYGISGVKGNEFQRVKLPPERGGILTQGSILTLTSNPTRTSPVKRGKWVMEQILGTPPPPPPPDVPELVENPKELKGSLRQRLEQHRANASCAVCHNKMDPLGIAFENFDAIGAWREKDSGFAIDPSGVLPDGKKFAGPKELKMILREKKDLFARCLSDKLLTYALGRGVEYYDRCAIDKIVQSLEKNDYKFSTLIMETVRSEPFLMRTAVGRKE